MGRSTTCTFATLLAIVLAGCGGGPAEPAGTGPVDCFAFEDGLACALDTCCDDVSCWYAASDGATWPCEDSAMCRDSESEPARDYCEVEQTGQTTFTAPCHWEGRWEIETAWCGEFEMINLVELYPDTVVEFETPRVGGCEVTISWNHESGCTASESWTLSSDAVTKARDMEVMLNGISQCDPEEACALGDHQNPVECRVGSRTATVRASLHEEQAAGLITIEGSWHPDVLPLCASPLAVTLAPLH